MATYRDDENIDYTYKAGEYTTVGGNARVDRARPTLSATDGYYNETLLRNILKDIQTVTDVVISKSEERLGDYTLDVSDGSDLQRAQIQEWPDHLNDDVKQFVPYMEYKALEKKETRGSEYIRKQYEDSVRSSFGTNAIDTLIVSKAIKQEATNVEQFLDDYLGDVDDTSEYRVLELLQDWATSGLRSAKTVATLFVQGVEKPVQIPQAELDTITEDTARAYQAFFQTKINTVNGEIKQLTEDLDKEHNIMSEIFYKKFLGPSLNFRLKVSRPLEDEAYAPTMMAAQALQADKVMGADLINRLADQMKRNENFDQTMNNLFVRMNARDTYVNFSSQLVDYGGQLSVGNGTIPAEDTSIISGANPFVKVDLDESDINLFQDWETEVTAQKEAEDSFISSHSALDGVDADDAHAQYPLKAGDTFTGDIGLAEGVKVDGIVPSAHRHTGTDGTLKIKGSDIEGGTLNVVTIDSEDKPAVPTNLRLIETKVVTVPPGGTVIDAIVGWVGDESNSYEVQISRAGV